ncbi:tigger transposable element-derived protein 4-like isoform X2 [Battus philenor]|uniref:tigger transposable element-derived protein 4-like isoform X2 n=1 Tax=Battus philenor TaxID=42288 RepID=UPI0035CEF292
MMASNTEAQNAKNDEISSEDEILSVVRSRVRKKANKRKRPPKKKYVVNDDEEEEGRPLAPHVFVRVQVEEIEEAPLDFSAGKYSRATVSFKKKRLFKCPQCDAVFELNIELKNHAKEHQVVTRHKCEPCGRYFNKAFSLRLHSRVHADKVEICPVCGARYALKINMLRHLKSHEQTEVCLRCPEKFQTKNLLEQHLFTHAIKDTPENLQLHAENDRTEQKPTEVRCTASDVSKSCFRSIKLEEESDENENKVKEVLNVSGNCEEFMKMEDLNHATLCAIVSKMHKGRPVPEVCRLYNLTPDVVNEIWEERDKYKLPKRAGKKYLNSLLETRLIEWFNGQRAKHVQMSGKMLQDIAETFAKESGFVAFNGSKKWLDRFKTKYKISLRGTPSKRDYTNIASGCKWKNLFFKETWCDMRLGFDDEDIYTGDEVGLYYNPSKGRIRKMSGRKFIQGHVKDRLSIFICANMTGSDKKRLVVCGTEDPLMHTQRDPDTLPVTYIRHAQAHFTTQMFEEYVKYWNRELQTLNRKAILILDRATIHSKLVLSNLKLVFVPWKASSRLIPIRNGIFNRFRDEFRRLFLLEKSMNAVRGVDRNVTCLEALYMLEKAWDRLPAHLINDSFRVAGYDVKRVEVSEERTKFPNNEEEILCELLKDYDVESYYTDLASLDMYLTVDEELVTGQGTNCSVFGGNHKVSESVKREKEKEMEELLPLGTEAPEHGNAENVLRRTRALEDLEIVRKYLHSTDTPFNMYADFMSIETFLLRNPFIEDP